MAHRRRSDDETFAEANRAFGTGAYRAAIRLYKSLLRTRPADPALLTQIGTAHGHLGDVDTARDYLRRAVEAGPTVARWCDLATACQRGGRIDEAWAACEAARGLDARDPDARQATANLHLLEGRPESAREILQEIVDEGRPAPTVVTLLAWACRSTGAPDAAAAAIESCLARPDLRDDQRASLLFARAEGLHRSGRYDEAFESYRAANAIKRARVRFDPAEHERAVDRMIAAWTETALRAAPRARVRNDQPVFVLGMPRSGTSLVEQILAAHPRVHGAGESGALFRIAERLSLKAAERGDPVDLLPVLNQREVNASASEYLRELTQGARSARRVTDKMTLNFLFLGLASLLVPKGRVIHCVRNPIDTCLSCYFQDFATSLDFAWDLEHLGVYHRVYRRLMAHWRAVVDVPILDVVYEDLVADPEPMIRRLVDFVDLEWDDACLRFHESDRVTVTASNEQVRQPVYRTSVERWRRYEGHLGELIGALGKAGGREGEGRHEGTEARRHEGTKGAGGRQ